MTKLWFGFLVLPLSLFGQSMGTISGTLSSGGAPVSGASVTAYLQATELSGKLPSPVNVRTGPDGAFTMKGVLPGVYRLCAEKPSAALLNPCEWSAAPTTLTVAAGGDASIALTAQKGVPMAIRVDDPAGVLAANPTWDDILISVQTTSGSHVPAVLATKNHSGKTMTVLVPEGLPVNLKIYSSRLSLSDDKGHSFAAPNVSVMATAPTAAIADSASSDALTLTVHGKKN